MKEFVIDLFCGAGGTSTGIHLADTNARVVACVNHDHDALQAHKLNHPWARHYEEDIRNPEVIFFLDLLVRNLRRLHPDCIITIWASLECTNFSNAKGGMPRDADSRTLAEHLYMYLDALDPDYLLIENVREFLAWGPLDKKGKPLSRKRGEDYLRWKSAIEKRGFSYDHRILNAADYGAYTIRKRLFIQFAKGNLPIKWPEQTHAKEKKKGLKLWKAVREVLDFTQEGISIFNRKKDLVENTLKRIYAGLIKFVADGDESFISDQQFHNVGTGVDHPSRTLTTNPQKKIVFIQKNFSGNPTDKVKSVDVPAGTILTRASNQSLVNCFMYQNNGGYDQHNKMSWEIDRPSRTVTASANHNAVFLHSYYGNGQPHDPDEPSPTITTKDRLAYVVMNYSSGQTSRSIDDPAGSVVGNDKHNLLEAFIYNPQYNNKGNAIDQPCPVVIARQDKKPLGMVVCQRNEGSFAIPVYRDDCETMVKIKHFMAAYGIVDIKMRMLLIPELLRIQGFPEDYQLYGNKTQQKKQIGNSVEVRTAMALFQCRDAALAEYNLKRVA